MYRWRILLVLVGWTLVALVIVAGPALVPQSWPVSLPSWMDDFSQRIVGLILLLFLTLVAIAFLIVRRDDIRLSVVGRTPELRAGSYQKTLGATVAVLVALIAVFGVMATVESTTYNTSTQLAAQEEAQLNERFEAAAQMLGDISSAVRSGGITALAAIADDWMARVDRGQTDEESARLRRDQCIRTIEAYLKTPLPQDNTTEWEEERAVRQVVYKVIGDHLYSVENGEVTYASPATRRADATTEPSRTPAEVLRSPRAGHNWGDHTYDFAHSYLPDADFDSMVFWPADTVDFSSAHFVGDARFHDTWFGDSTSPADATFLNAGFSSTAYFREAVFWGDANFWPAEFWGDANFEHASFRGNANFWYA